METKELIEQLRDSRQIFETKLRNIIAKELDMFKTCTGVSIKSITIKLDHYEAVGTNEYRYFVKNVQCEIAI